MTTFREQLKLLLWKNWILRRRHKVRVVMEFVWPLILFLILMWVRTRGLKVHRPNCHVQEKTLPSVGGLEFFQNYFCTLNNTCYDGYVENESASMWENALISRVVKEATPILEEVLSSPQGIDTVKKLWHDFMGYVKIIGAVRGKTEARKLGKVKLKELLPPKGVKGFMSSAQLYTNFQKSELEQLLESELNLEALNKESLDEVLEDLKQGKCHPEKEYKLITIQSKALFKELCSVDRQQALVLTVLFQNYMDKHGLAKRLRDSVEGEQLMEEFNPITAMLNYDIQTLQTLGQLSRVVQLVSKGFTNSQKNLLMSTSPPDDLEIVRPTITNEVMAGAFIYEGLCGVNYSVTLVGPDADGPGIYDTFRDRLRDWKSEDQYVIDPEISTQCNGIFQQFESTTFTSLLWRQVKPFVRGVIHFSPDTPFTRSIMEGVDARFSQLKGINDGLASFVSIVQQIRHWLQAHVDDLNDAKEVLTDKSNVERLMSLIDVSMSENELQQIHEILEKISNTEIENVLSTLDHTAEIASKIMSCVRYNKSRPFATEWEAVNAGIELLSQDNLWAVIIFSNIDQNNDTVPHHIHYKIRMDSDKVDGTRLARDRLTSKSPRRRPIFDLKYITYGFAYLQEMIERTIIENVTGQSVDDIPTYLQQFPYPCFIYDQFIRAISRTFPMFMVLSWVYASAMIVKSIVFEKELKLKEVMKVMGLGNGVIWTGWFIDSFVIMAISATVLSAILKFGKVIEHSDLSLIWVFMISYTVATIMFSFLISTLFTRANSAAAAGGILFFVSYLPYNFLMIWEERLTWYNILSGCLVSNVAFGFGCTYFARFEEDGIGAQWNGITWQTLPGDDFNLIYCIGMLWVDSLLYGILTWYIEAVFPGDAGVAKPWYFLFTKSYWIGQRAPKSIGPESVPVFSALGENDSLSSANEKEPKGLKKGVSVYNLTKVYSNGRVALQDLNLSFYEGQITSFLGHNGAGKTTTISILTGLFPPTKGTAKIYGRDIRTDMDVIRTDLGICPQFNVLFDRLNVEEHLMFYAGLKGKLDKNFKLEVKKILSDLGIPTKAKEFPNNLSGGMKRKLSVAIAFAGGSKMIFLDEPTSGVDPYSRRSIWELLLKYKNGRTIILTTHFMDEADLLGDRIAIISRGKLKAFGSSLFLKNRFGQGYSLRLVREETKALSLQVPEITQVHDQLHSQSPNGRHLDTMKGFLSYRVPNAVLVDDVGSEVVFLLPYESIGAFSTLFNDLDANLSNLGISSYGISDTTLEDVFLKITFEDLEETDPVNLSTTCKTKCISMFNRLKRRKQWNKPLLKKNIPTVLENGDAAPHLNAEDANNANVQVVISNGNGDLSDGETSLLSESVQMEDDLPSRNLADRRHHGLILILIQIWMINLKRFKNSMRNKKAMFFEIILPAVFVAITLAFTLIIPPSTDEPAREISPWTYPSPNNIFFSMPTVKEDVKQFETLVDELVGPVGMGTACMKDQVYADLCNSKSWSNKSVADFNAKRKEFKGSSLGECSCTVGSLRCPNAIEPAMPSLAIPSHDILHDVSKINIPEWLEKTYRMYETKRYGGFEMQLRNATNVDLTNFLSLVDSFVRLTPLPNHSYLNVSNTKSTKAAYKVWYENRGWVSSVAYLNGLHNMILRENVPSEFSDQKNEFGITLYTHPLNLTKSQQNKESLKTAGLGVVHAICVIFALSFVPASFTVYLIEERKSGGKHLHLVSGVKPATYWISNFLYDILKYSVPALCCVALFIMFDAQAYVSEESLPSFIILLILYGWASIPLMYPASFVFGIPSTAFVVLACTNLFVGVVTTVSTFVLEQFGDKELEHIGSILKKVFLIFPQYCLGRGLMELVQLDIASATSRKFSIVMPAQSRFDWDILGKLLFFLLIEGTVFFILNFSLEYRHLIVHFCRRKTVRTSDGVMDADDVDVQRETERILCHPQTDATLVAVNLTKFYQKKIHPAVNSLCFGIEKGECFGLLGVNGAGKTSTFKMLTGDVRISSGSAKICGYDVEASLDSAREHFGYCPQEDGLDPLLNAYEQLQLYGRLRGMSAKETEQASSKLIQALGLTRYADKSCGTYSGGNKRKMSTAIALIGDPEIVFLDEPTSGMDPGARRQLWKVIIRLIRIGKSVVLTSHSMEECEALCTRLAIMVNGKFVCFGSLQHLKNRFGNGYTLTVRCPQEQHDEFIVKMLSDMPSAVVEDSHCSQIKFNIPQDDAKLCDIFSLMYSSKAQSMIEDYSLSQTTLDDIFVKFASEQKDDMDR